MSASQPDSVSRRALRHPCLISGGILGVCMAATAIAWVLIANRVPALDRFAFQRNLAAAVALGLLALVPALRFFKSPARIFLSGIVAWTILAAAYRIMENPFPLLSDRLGAFHLFMMGAVVFGVMSVALWVAQLILHTRQQALAPARRRLP